MNVRPVTIIDNTDLSRPMAGLVSSRGSLHSVLDENGATVVSATLGAAVEVPEGVLLTQVRAQGLMFYRKTSFRCIRTSGVVFSRTASSISPSPSFDRA